MHPEFLERWNVSSAYPVRAGGNAPTWCAERETKVRLSIRCRSLEFEGRYRWPLGRPESRSSRFSPAARRRADGARRSRCACELPYGPPFGVVGARNHEQIEGLVGFDQRVHDLHRRRRIDVRVQLTDDEQQIALQLRRVVDVRRRGVLWTERPSHPLLVPPDLVHSVVVAPAGRHRGLVELRMEEHARRASSARRPTCRRCRRA